MILVHAVHPAPLVQIPKGGRLAKRSWIRAVTPVEVPERALQDFEPLRPVQTFRFVERLWSGPGGLWREIDPMGADPLGMIVDFLERRETLSDQLRQSLSRTPFRLAGIGPDVHMEPFDPAGCRRIVADGTAEAASAIRAFVSDRVALAGGKLLVRGWEPMIRHLADTTRRTHVVFETAGGPNEVLSFRMDRRGMTPDIIEACAYDLPGIPTLPSELLGDDDVLLAHCRLLEIADSGMRITSRYWKRYRDERGLPDDTDEISPFRQELTDAASRTRRGMAEVGECHRLAQLAERAWAKFAETLDPFQYHGLTTWMAAQLTQCKRLAPFLEPPVADADMAALGGP